MGADVLATQGARASGTMIITKFNRNNSVPVRWGLILIFPFNQMSKSWVATWFPSTGTEAANTQSAIKLREISSAILNNAIYSNISKNNHI